MQSFVTKCNNDHPDFHITSKSLYDWLKKTKSGNVDKLADRRGGYNRGTSSIPQKYQDYFTNIFLNQTQPTLKSCFDETRIFANANGEIIPGIKAFITLYKRMNKAMLIRYREGEKAFIDKCIPCIERDYSLLSPNDWWVSDHHLWDVFVRVSDNEGGWKLARPWGSYWMDMRTRKMMSSIIRIEEPNSDIVVCSFGLGVEHHGVPKGIRLDNGKDYKAKDLFTEEELNSIGSNIATNLQFHTTYAIAYNAKAKPIERVFNTFEEQFGKKLASYAGSNAKKRPEDLKKLDIMEYMTLEEFIEIHNKYEYEIYNESPHKGDAMYNKSPNYMYSKLEFVLRTVSKDALYFSLMRCKGTRTVQRNGITFDGVHFYNDNCINYIGQKTIAKYDPTEPEILYIFDIHENFLFIATKIQKQGWNLTEEVYHKENERKKIAKQKALNSYTKDNTIRSTKSIRDRIEMISDSISKSEIATPTVIEPIRNEKIEETVKRINMTDLEKNYEDVLNRQRASKKAVNDRQQQFMDKFKNKMIDLSYSNQA